MKRHAAVILTVLGSFFAVAQEFEVASIKPSDPNGRFVSMRASPGQVNFTGVTLKILIQSAYGVRDSQIIGSSGWINSDRWDIVAKVPDSAGEQALPQDPTKLTDGQRQTMQQRRQAMLQALLANRFQLKIHKETREMPVYFLTVAKGGPKLKDNGGKTSDPDLRPGMFRMSPGLITASQMDMPRLANTLSQFIGRTVVDRTGLSGKYDIDLKWTPDQFSGRGALGAAPEPGPQSGAVGNGAGPQPPPGVPSASVFVPPDANGPTIFTAIQEQLGLKLESGKGPVEVIVIDHAEKPTEN